MALPSTKELSIHQGFIDEPLIRNVVRDHDGAREQRKVVRDGPVDFDASLSVCSPAQREPCETPHDAARQEHEHEPPVDPHGTLTFCCFPEEAPPRMVFMVPWPMPPQTVRAASGLRRRKKRYWGPIRLSQGTAVHRYGITTGAFFATRDPRQADHSLGEGRRALREELPR